ncbi:MAG: HTTM domain-containing protein [Myxococcales bacterium]|nr:HTTM domain-containing protein [Myxococcales bacterium]
MVLLILALSGADRNYSLRRSGGTTHIASWPYVLIAWFLALMYMNTGFCKLNPDPSRWLGIDNNSEVLRILTFPLFGALEISPTPVVMSIFQVLDVATVIVECSAFLLLTRFRQFWGILGMTLHISIALSMKLGIFSWGMLALYPVIFSEWVCRLLTSLERCTQH